MTKGSCRAKSALALACVCGLLFYWTVLAAPDEVRVSSFGYDAEDATRFLQAAIDSGAKKVIVDRMPTPWVVTPLAGSSHQEIFLENGVELVAKRGAFVGGKDVLLSYTNACEVKISGYGATIRMWRDDYLKPPYSVSEWRHAISFIACDGVLVEGIRIEGSGGDGIYLGALDRKHPCCRNVQIRDVECLRNARQGMSVISVDGLRVENSKFGSTRGRPPEAGIDFEPNHPFEVLKGISMRGCEFYGNKGSGIEIALMQFRSSTEPVSMHFENCRTIGNRNSLKVGQKSAGEDFVQGRISFANCSFCSAEYSAMSFLQKPQNSVGISFDNCRIENACSKVPDLPDVHFANRKRADDPPDGIDFGQLSVFAPCVRQPFAFTESGWSRKRVVAITGCVSLRNPDGKENITLDDAWRDAFSPVLVGPVHSDLRLSASNVVDFAQGELLELGRFTLRGAATYVFYADKGMNVRLGYSVRLLRRRAAWPGKVKIRSLSEGWKSIVRVNPKAEEMEVSVPKSGFYALEFQIGKHAFTLNAANVPVAIWMNGDEAQDFIDSTGTLAFNVQKGERFGVHLSGEGMTERVGAELTNPTGVVLWNRQDILGWESFCQTAEDTGLWRIRLKKPSVGSFEDVHLDLTGTSPLLFLSPKRHW